VLLFLTKPLSFMPNAVLAAVVFLIGIELVDVPGMRSILKARPVEFWVAFITAATVVLIGVEQGIILAIIISMIAHIRHSYRPSDRLVTYEHSQAKLHSLASGAQAAPGLLVYHFGANLYYANVEAFEGEVVNLIQHASPKVKWFAVEASSIGDVDFTAAEMLRKLIPTLQSRGVTFILVDLPDESRAELEASDLLGVIRNENILAGLHDLIKKYESAS
ncbi:MAG TPA: STAS domain-containing protein, partial [Candidatus Limnocylindrales bacterium]